MKSMRKVQKASGVRSLRDTQFREKCALDYGKSSQGRSTNGRKNGASSLIVGYSDFETPPFLKRRFARRSGTFLTEQCGQQGDSLLGTLAGGELQHALISLCESETDP